MTLHHDLAAGIAALLANAGIDAKPGPITPCTKGANNRTYRIDTATGSFVVKQYFRHDDDARDRMAAEYAFLAYAQTAAPGLCPRPYACDTERSMALYEFMAGRAFRSGEVGAHEVQMAIRFFCALNAKAASATAELPAAAESCFSITEHIALVDARVSSLLDAVHSDAADDEAREFMQRLSVNWRNISEQALIDVARAKIDPTLVLTAEQRCITPSDFGFHNALRSADGTIQFLDFEYAGWDDPAKTTGDFFQQISVPVPPEHFEMFAAGIARCFPDPDATRARIHVLRPIYAIKWCCIVLNVFLPVHLARRRFADPGIDAPALKRSQLAKAENMLKSLNLATTKKEPVAWLTSI